MICREETCLRVWFLSPHLHPFLGWTAGRWASGRRPLEKADLPEHSDQDKRYQYQVEEKLCGQPQQGWTLFVLGWGFTLIFLLFLRKEQTPYFPQEVGCGLQFLFELLKTGKFFMFGSISIVGIVSGDPGNPRLHRLGGR